MSSRQEIWQTEHIYDNRYNRSAALMTTAFLKNPGKSF